MQRTDKIKGIPRPHKEELLAKWNKANWAIACTQMQDCLARGSIDNAVEILKRFAISNIPRMASLDTHVSEIFHYRLAQMLEDAGYLNLRSLHLAKDEELRLIDHIGESYVQFIRETLRAVIKGETLAIDITEDFEAIAQHSYADL